jgi:peptidoglycan/LPS O-acetylase OafA/YrhL
MGRRCLSIGRCVFPIFWTLCVEEQFYLVWPLIVRYCRRRTLFGACALMVVLPLLATLLNSHPGRALGAFGRSRVLRFSGMYSYGLYVFHFLLMPAYARIISIVVLAAWCHSAMLAVVMFAVIGLVVMTGIALASYHLYEKWFLRLKRWF